MLNINIAESKLSDGSEVYAVIIGSVYLPAVTFGDAETLAAKIHDAIIEHTNEDVRIVYDC